MIFKCSTCIKDYDEEDEDQIILGISNCEMVCIPCAREIYDNAKKIMIVNI